MCLHVINKIIKEPTSKEVWGYKIFGVSKNGKIYGDFFHTSTPYKIGVWLKARRTNINDIESYMSGFHAFTSKKQALSYNGSSVGLVKVKLRYVETYGIQQDYNVIVAQQMFIPKGEK